MEYTIAAVSSDIVAGIIGPLVTVYYPLIYNKALDVLFTDWWGFTTMI